MVIDVGGLSGEDFESKKYEVEPTNPEQAKVYIVDLGPFVRIPLRRGVTEIMHLLKKLEGRRAFICGGYARYSSSPKPEPVDCSDIDIYCQDEETFKILKNEFTIDKLEVKHENEVSLTFRRPKEGDYSYHHPIQLIKPLEEGKVVTQGDVETILRNFDFTIIRCAILDSTTALVDPNFIHDEEKGLLRLLNIHCPVSSTLRCLKYSRKGYWLRPLECLKLFLDWDSRSDDYRIKLADFLTKASEGNGLSQQEVDELEALMRID